MIHLELYGDPIPLKRPRFKRGKSFVMTYDPQAKEKEHYRWQLRGQFRNNPLKMPISLDITFFMKIPKGTSSIKSKCMISGQIQHVKRPDVDNLTKWVMDLMNGLVFEDDSQVWHLTAKKIYAEHPGTLIKVQPTNLHQEIEDEKALFPDSETNE